MKDLNMEKKNETTNKTISDSGQVEPVVRLKLGHELKVGDTIKTWFSNGQDRIKKIQWENGNYIYPEGYAKILQGRNDYLKKSTI